MVVTIQMDARHVQSWRRDRHRGGRRGSCIKGETHAEYGRVVARVAFRAGRPGRHAQGEAPRRKSVLLAMQVNGARRRWRSRARPQSKAARPTPEPSPVTSAVRPARLRRDRSWPLSGRRPQAGSRCADGRGRRHPCSRRRWRACGRGPAKAAGGRCTVIPGLCPELIPPCQDGRTCRAQYGSPAESMLSISQNARFSAFR